MLQYQEMKAIIDYSEGNYSASVLNRCYGGFAVSDFAMDLYGKRYKEKFGKEFKDSNQDLRRDDAILIDLVKEYPDRVSRSYSKLMLAYYPKKYHGFFRCFEEDGNEYGDINVEAYKLYNINAIVKSTLNDDSNKIQQINAVLDDPCEDACVRDDDEPPTDD